MMRDNEFRKALDECLEQVRRGVSPEECLKAYPQHAERLLPFLRSAATLRGLGVPEPSVSSMQKARNTLLERVVSGNGKETAVVRGVFKFANVAGVAVAALFVAGLGLVGAAGPGGFLGGSDDGHVKFHATVISVAPTLFYVQNTDNGEFVFTVFSEHTRFLDAEGHAISSTDINRRAEILVTARHSGRGPRFFDAILIRIAGENPEPTKAPTVEPTKAPEPTAAPTEKPAPEPTVKPTEKPRPEPTKAPTPKPTEKPAAQEFWAIVLAIAETHMTVQTAEGATITLNTTAETQFPNGYPFVGVKVWVLATRNGDGSWTALKVTVKTVDFMGTVTGIEPSTFFVNSNGSNMTVHSDAHTEFPNGVPVVGDTVGVFAYKLGDGSYLAKKIIIKEIPVSFTGVIVEHLPGEFIIKVDVGGTVKVVCYEFADVIGTLAVGATVYVEVDHTEADTHFARLVKMMG